MVIIDEIEIPSIELVNPPNPINLDVRLAARLPVATNAISFNTEPLSNLKYKSGSSNLFTKNILLCQITAEKIASSSGNLKPDESLPMTGAATPAIIICHLYGNSCPFKLN